MALRLLLLLIFSNLLGCVPVAAPPKIVLPHLTRAGVKIVPHSSRGYKQTLWWRKMHDAVLNRLMDQTLQHNNQLLSTKATIEQAQAQLKAARNLWLPTLSAVSDEVLVKGWSTNYKPQGPLSTNTVLSDLHSLKANANYSGFMPSYTLNALANNNNVLLAKASVGIQQGIYQALRLSIISQVAGAYFTLLGEREQLFYEKQLINDLSHLRHLEWVRYKDGMSDSLVLTSIDQNIATHRSSIKLIESSLEHTENALQLLLGKNPGPIFTSGRLDKLVLNGMPPSELPATVLINHPDIMIAREQFRSAAALQGLAYSRFFPTFSLTGLLGTASLDLTQILKLTTNAGFAQLAAAIPLFNGVSYQQIQSSKAEVKAASFNYLQVTRTVLMEVDNSLTDYQKRSLMIKDEREAVHATQQAYQLNRVKHQTGAQDYRPVIQARVALTQAKIKLIIAKMEQLRALVAVYQAVAGGYEKPVKTPPLDVNHMSKERTGFHPAGNTHPYL